MELQHRYKQLCIGGPRNLQRMSDTDIERAQSGYFRCVEPTQVRFPLENIGQAFTEVVYVKLAFQIMDRTLYFWKDERLSVKEFELRVLDLLLFPLER